MPSPTSTPGLTRSDRGHDTPAPATAPRVSLPHPGPRPAWVEIDLARLRRNLALIWRDKPEGLKVLAVVKDGGYGHGALAVARAALDAGASFLAVSTIQEGAELRDAGLRVPILLLGDRQPDELPWCLEYDLTCSVSEPGIIAELAALAAAADRRMPVHLKVNSGMNRYGVRWTQAPGVAAQIAAARALHLEGVFSHFAQSDETDKSYANLQDGRFREALAGLAAKGIHVPVRHLCNSGGFLDLPHAHFDMVRLGILPLGVFPSTVCRRIDGLEPVMTVKARIAALQDLETGDCVGYGMRYTAPSPRRIAVLPIGYGDGFPRVRNQGAALLHGRRAPLIGGVAMDALTVDVTDIPEARVGDEAVLMGRQGAEEITVREVAALKNSVTYDVLVSWRGRLPRHYVGGMAGA